jgi:transcriptional regulator with PAS, ATPase and Fis domain
MLGESLKMREIFAILEKISPKDITVLIEGETGTGKEVCARAIHNTSKRASGPFIIFDCGATPANLIESELFGHVKGAFTGAVSSRAGAFESADGGTIFFDELGELTLELQPKLLRVLETREVKRVGATTPVKVDVRVVAATNRDLRKEVRSGNFREDLFYRLAVARVTLPALRERREDIALLAKSFLRDASGDPNREISEATLTFLRKHDWPGNIRELPAAGGKFQRRLEEAHRPGEDFDHQSRRVAARRADQPPRRRSDRLAGELAGDRLQGGAVDDQPRPRLHEPAGDPDYRGGGRHHHHLWRQLRFLPA